jgi:hypothetical protein
MSLESNAVASLAAGKLRWGLRFSLFLLLFTVFVLAAVYGLQSLRGANQTAAPAAAPAPAPAASPATPLSGATGHAQ